MFTKKTNKNLFIILLRSIFAKYNGLPLVYTTKSCTNIVTPNIMESTKYDVFISYSTIDKIIAEAVCGYLESHRVRCFVAYRDIPKGDDWAQAIPPALRGSLMMLAVFSQAFNVSEQTDNELHIAAHRKIPILTFRITDDDFDGAKEYFLAKSNWIDAFPEPEKQFGELLRSVQVLLGMKFEPNKVEKS